MTQPVEIKVEGLTDLQLGDALLQLKARGEDIQNQYNIAMNEWIKRVEAAKAKAVVEKTVEEAKAE